MDGAPHHDPGADTAEIVTAVLRQHPEIARRLADLRAAAWRVVDPALLELCRLRIAQLLGDEREQAMRTPDALASGLDEATIADLRRWPTSDHFGARERACLAFCEQFVIDVAGLTDEVAGAVSGQLGPAAFVDFVNAVLIVEQRQRLRLAWERLLLPLGAPA